MSQQPSGPPSSALSAGTSAEGEAEENQGRVSNSGFMLCTVQFETISKLAHLLFCIKDLSLLVTGPPQLLLLEVGVVQSFGDLDTRDVHLGVGGNDKLLVSPAQGNSVQGKRA